MINKNITEIKLNLQYFHTIFCHFCCQHLEGPMIIEELASFHFPLCSVNFLNTSGTSYLPLSNSIQLSTLSKMYLFEKLNELFNIFRARLIIN